MIEAYAFLAIFTLQIIAASVVYPAWFIRYLRRQAISIPAEHLPHLYPDVDASVARERFLSRYRALHKGIAVLGLLLLGWLFTYMQRPGWHVGPVDIVVTVYCSMQMLLPLGLVIRHGVRFTQTHKRSWPQRKRKAILQRRGLFDFVSPLTVFLAVLGYLLFAAFVAYLQQRPPLASAGLIDIGATTLIYALQAWLIYAVLYGKKSNPFETHATRVRTIGLVVKSCIYSGIACVAFLSMNLGLELMDLQKWLPFALSAFFVVTAALSLMGMTAPPRSPESDGPGSAGLSTAGTRDASA
ncbi:MAG TPA: hypothetical protein VI653_04470 [Steroidobacteraceae bacterium]